MAATTAIGRKLLLVLLLVAVAVEAHGPRGASAALSCFTVYNKLKPCLGYVQNGGAVPGACCSGIKRLVAAARSKSDRRAVCTCLKNVAAGAKGGPSISRAAGLPGRCGVQLPYKLGPNVNCNLIN